MDVNPPAAAEYGERGGVLQHIKPIRVMLVDDHRSVLWGLEKLIDADKPNMEVVGKATNCAAAIEMAKKAAPDVVVLDLDLGGENACEIIPVLVNGGGTRVLIWTGMRDSRARVSREILPLFLCSSSRTVG